MIYHRLSNEWRNFDDHDAGRWIAGLRERREDERQKRLEKKQLLGAELEDLDARPTPPISGEESAWWREHFRLTRYWVEQYSLVGWDEALVAATCRDYGARAAANPQFIGLLLRLLDTRPVAVEDLQITLDIPCGHLYRFLKRGGAIWKASSGYMMHEADEDELGAALGFYRDPLANVVIVRGKVRRPPSGNGWWTTLAWIDDARPSRPPMWPQMPNFLGRRKQHRAQRSVLTHTNEAS